MTPPTRLSKLLDETLDLPLSEREPWLAALAGEVAALAPTRFRAAAREALTDCSE